jgi:hypothetical protein
VAVVVAEENKTTSEAAEAEAAASVAEAQAEEACCPQYPEHDAGACCPRCPEHDAGVAVVVAPSAPCRTAPAPRTTGISSRSTAKDHRYFFTKHCQGRFVANGNFNAWDNKTGSILAWNSHVQLHGVHGVLRDGAGVRRHVCTLRQEDEWEGAQQLLEGRQGPPPPRPAGVRRARPPRAAAAKALFMSATT